MHAVLSLDWTGEPRNKTIKKMKKSGHYLFFFFVLICLFVFSLVTYSRRPSFVEGLPSVSWDGEQHLLEMLTNAVTKDHSHPPGVTAKSLPMSLGWGGEAAPE